MTVKWHGEKFYRRAKTGTQKALKKVAQMVELEAKSLMTRGGRTPSGRAVPLREGSRTMIDPETGQRAGRIGSYRSRPGEPPRVQTGTLRRSITHELHPTLPIARVGTNVTYGKWLELGTRKMARRPFMTPAYMKVRTVAAAIFRDIVGGEIERGP